MTAEELIATLRRMPPDARVYHVWDGQVRTQIRHVWLAADGRIVTADQGEVVYDREDRPNVGSAQNAGDNWKTAVVEDGRIGLE